MLRALEHGYSVRMARTAHVTFSVDTPDDLARVSLLMEGDALIHPYTHVASGFSRKDA